MSQAFPVVFIPALLCDERLYADVITALGDRIDAKVMMSPKPHIEESAADILARAPEKFVLAGSSYGGVLAMHIALVAPERVTALWLLGCDPGAPRPGGPNLAAGLEAAPDKVIELLSTLVVHRTAIGPAQSFKSMAQAVGGTAGATQARAAAARTDITPRLGELSMPVLALWGQEDALVAASVGRGLAQALPDGRFYELPGCGHLPTLEKPVESAAHFEAFLESLVA
ncbi:MAG: alpha/beta hydrolase [Pseudomonadota bacterium]